MCSPRLRNSLPNRPFSPPTAILCGEPMRIPTLTVYTLPYIKKTHQKLIDRKTTLLQTSDFIAQRASADTQQFRRFFPAAASAFKRIDDHLILTLLQQIGRASCRARGQSPQSTEE